MEGAELCFPELLNTSCSKPNYSPSDMMFFSIIVCLFSFLTMILNLLVIIAIMHFRQLHTSTNVLLLSLAFSDFIMGFLLFFQIFLNGCWYLGNIMCALITALGFIVASTSVQTMVLISIDRYVAICDPLHYPTKVTLKRTQVSVSVCWTCSLVYSTVILKEDLQQPGRFNSCVGECTFEIGLTGFIVDLLLTFLLPVIVIIILYVTVFVVAVSQIRAMRSHVAAVSHQRSGKPKKSEIKAARTLGVVIVVFLLCLCPYFCVSVLSPESIFSSLSGAYLLILYYVNSCLNPLIYALFYPWFRKSIKIIVTLKILKSGSSDANLL
ncbi:PREDICTED: trace amine-associated receptor 13c-like [Poecilia mexicana]|uniref:trace amine-associated receptor 13c-like n=1 Tax=Poecilia mexicana TaxID=48701 RepID=UPI00072E2C42|nr:PREDICTED: trace amine-associated receptor 13c-like [Poecilia mexicana]